MSCAISIVLDADDTEAGHNPVRTVWRVLRFMDTLVARQRTQPTDMPSRGGVTLTMHPTTRADLLVAFDDALLWMTGRGLPDRIGPAELVADPRVSPGKWVFTWEAKRDARG